MLIRLLHGAGALVLLAVLAWLLAGRADPLIAAATDLRGELWYRVVLHGRHVGHLRTDTRRDLLGRWRFDSELEFTLNPGEPVVTRESLLFAALPPHALLRASQQTERAGLTEGTLIERHGGTYRVTRQPANGFRALELDYTLADHLGFEAWLKEAAPAPGATRAVRALDFGRRQVVARQFRVVEQNATGYRIAHAAPLDASTIQLDARLRPVTMSLAGQFELELASREEALDGKAAVAARGRPVPVDRPLPHHTEIRALALEVEGPVPAAQLWPQLTVDGALYSTAGSVGTPRLLGDELMETADHPVSDPRIRALAEQAVAGAGDPDARLGALTRFVHEYLRYTDDGVRRDVLTLLDEPLGDCNEYAELLTTLARALDIPSRTVFGLAYAADDTPAFRFHAWNELLVDGEWRAVDPTWNQLRIDATHIPLPQNVTYAMGLLTGGLDLRFNVRDVRYE